MNLKLEPVSVNARVKPAYQACFALRGAGFGWHCGTQALGLASYRWASCDPGLA